MHKYIRNEPKVSQEIGITTRDTRNDRTFRARCRNVDGSHDRRVTIPRKFRLFPPLCKMIYCFLQPWFCGFRPNLKIRDCQDKVLSCSRILRYYPFNFFISIIFYRITRSYVQIIILNSESIESFILFRINFWHY